jgi:hypothetical protein
MAEERPRMFVEKELEHKRELAEVAADKHAQAKAEYDQKHKAWIDAEEAKKRAHDAMVAAQTACRATMSELRSVIFARLPKEP